MDDLETSPPGPNRGSIVGKPSDPLHLGSEETASKTLEMSEETWLPSKHEKAIIYTLALLNLIISLDATIIVTALPVIPPYNIISTQITH